MVKSIHALARAAAMAVALLPLSPRLTFAQSAPRVSTSGGLLAPARSGGVFVDVSTSVIILAGSGPPSGMEGALQTTIGPRSWPIRPAFDGAAWYAWQGDRFGLTTVSSWEYGAGLRWIDDWSGALPQIGVGVMYAHDHLYRDDVIAGVESSADVAGPGVWINVGMTGRVGRHHRSTFGANLRASTARVAAPPLASSPGAPAPKRDIGNIGFGCLWGFGGAAPRAPPPDEPPRDR